MSGQKLGHWKKLVYTLESRFSARLSKNLVRIFVLMKSRTSSKMGHDRSNTRSQGQILEKPLVHSRGHIFSPIIMKLCQNFCLDETSDKFENGSCRVKNQVKSKNHSPEGSDEWLQGHHRPLVSSMRWNEYTCIWRKDNIYFSAIIVWPAQERQRLRGIFPCVLPVHVWGPTGNQKHHHGNRSRSFNRQEVGWCSSE